MRYSVQHGHVISIKHMVRQGVSTEGMLHLAAQHGQLGVVIALVRHGLDVNAANGYGTTALMIAAEHGHTNVMTQLVQLGTDANSKDDYGKTALMIAAKHGHTDVVTHLVQLGAYANIKDDYGKTALMIAAKHGHTEVIVELARLGSVVNAADAGGTTALMKAALSGLTEVATQLILLGADANVKDKYGKTALMIALKLNHTQMAVDLLHIGADTNATDRDGETALTIAGCGGHMQIFETLVKVGAPVNVRSNSNGETPLISIARVDNFPAVSLLIAHGNGSSLLCFDDVQDDEYPLLPGSLATMTTMCAAVTFEFEPVCDHMMARLQIVCSALQQCKRQKQQQKQNSTAVPPPDQSPATEYNDALVTFACIVFRACRLLFDVEKKRTVLSRFIASRAILRRINDIDDELIGFARMHGLALGEEESPASASPSNAHDDWLQRQQQVQLRFKQALSSNDALFFNHDRYNTRANNATAVLLQYEIALRRQEQNLHAQASVVDAVLARFMCLREMKTAPEVPVWFLSRDDLEYHSWNIVKTDNEVKRYAGKWRGTSVTIETYTYWSDSFQEAASQWHALNHPNVVKLLGACHIGEPKLLVFESTPGDLLLHEFLRVSESNRSLTWKVLYDAALGLQYMHSRDVAHDCLQSEMIIIGSDKTARLSHIGVRIWLFNIHKRRRVQWEAPEHLLRRSTLPTAVDIYAFGMCIWEAVTLELPWKEMWDWEIRDIVKAGCMPDRPPSMRDDEWELINDMCAHNLNRRIDIAHVVRRLKKIMLKRDQVMNNNSRELSSSSADNESKSKSKCLDKHYFVELGRTIPKALKVIKMTCEELADDEQWLATAVLPALEFVFSLLQEREMVPTDAEVKAFVNVLGRLERFVRIAWSDKSVYQQMRSRKVAETHRVVYDELDRLLDMLSVSEDDAIRVWQHEMASSIAGATIHDVVGSDDADASSSDIITLNHLNTPPANYEQWTRDGLVRAAALASIEWRPIWYLALRELVFSESDKIGQGAFGAVYKGKWGDAQVVIKFMGYEDDLDTISTDLLLHEVRAWHRLNHPHVLRLYGACHVDKRYFVCELASGGELIKYLNEQQPDNTQLKWEKLHEAALGLQYLHSVGVAHNDLKCDNIMIGADGRAKLIDFGLSCLLGEAEIQIAATSIGAVNWRSPEYLAGDRPSSASDVYSFAMCIIEVVTSEVPWGKHTLPAAITYQQKKGNTTPPLPASMTAKQRNLLEVMTTFEPTERVGMAFVVNKLHEIVQDETAVRPVA